MRNINILSVVIPCHDEEEALSMTHARLGNVLNSLIMDRKCAAYEIIYVDDGSKDDTLRVLESIFRADSRVKIISLRRNFGLQGAISAGMFYARGEAVITIDADLQDPPEKIGEMITYFERGYDLVLGVRKDRSSDSLMKRFFAENYYRLVRLMGVDIVYNHGDFRLMARPLVDEFNNLSERNRFIRALILKLESHYAVVYYEREPRRAGRSKFTVDSMFSFCLDGITSFSYVPLRLALLFGVFMCIGAAIGIAWVLYTKIATDIVPGWASIALPVMAFGGFQLLVLGLIGEYVGRLYIEVKRRPLFVVRKEYAHSAPEIKNMPNAPQEDKLLK